VGPYREAIYSCAATEPRPKKMYIQLVRLPVVYIRRVYLLHLSQNLHQIRRCFVICPHSIRASVEILVGAIILSSCHVNTALFQPRISLAVYTSTKLKRCMFNEW
jgi:hypothetical protein